MKKTIAIFSIGAMFVLGGFFFSSTPIDSAMEVEPSIFSVEPDNNA